MKATEGYPKRWREGFEAFARVVSLLTADLSPEAFNRAPGPGRWSVGQCLDHLNETGGRLAPRLEEALAEAPPAPAGKEPRLCWRDRLFEWSMQPGGWLKMPSPGAYRPAAGGLDPEHGAQAFRALQERLARCAEAAEGRDWSAVMVTSPASRFVRLSAGGWLAGTLAHQRRHFRQARAARRQAARQP